MWIVYDTVGCFLCLFLLMRRRPPRSTRTDTLCPNTTLFRSHILLGLLREEGGLAARILESLDITVERVRAQVVRIVGSGEEVTSGQIPFTPRAKKVLELALREALSLGHNYIGTDRKSVV